jgi:predicted alpha/beta-hydrolase family hydrolase
MAFTVSKRLTIDVNDTTQVSGLLENPNSSRLCLVLAHGAGAGMEHPSMAAIAQDLAARDIATLRYQFPYMERGEKRTDRPPLCHAAVRAAVAAAAQLIPEVPLIAGGKSFGGRMTSQAQAVNPLPGVRGLAFFGFPLHPPDKPSIDRAAHLSKVKVPMLFLQGTRDNLADLTLLRPLVGELENLATLKVLEAADHSFHVLKRSGRNDEEVNREMIDAFIAWAEKLPAAFPIARLGSGANGG